MPHVRKPRSCEVCAANYRPSYHQQRACGRTCGGVIRAASIAAIPPKPREPVPARTRVWVKDCDQCGKVFISRSGNAKRCSAQCRIDHGGVRLSDLYATALRMRLGGARWRLLLVDYLHERDGDKCAICTRRMDFTLSAGPRGDDRGVTIDHVIPRSHGGSDEPANLRLSHWSCNRSRKAKGGNEQLRLVG